MRNHNDYYKRLVNEHPKIIPEEYINSMQREDTCFEISLIALVHSVAGNNEDASARISEAEKRNCNDFENAILAESKLIIDVNQKDDLYDLPSTEIAVLRRTAEEIINLNKDAYFANVFLGTLAHIEKNFQEALDIYLALLDIYPSQIYLIRRIIVILLAKRDYLEARKYIQMLPPGLIKWRFLFLERIFLRYQILWVLVSSLLLLSINLLILTIIMVPAIIVVLIWAYKAYKNKKFRRYRSLSLLSILFMLALLLKVVE